MASYNYYQPNILTSWTITHNLQTKAVAMDVLKQISDGKFEKIMPDGVSIIDDNTIVVTFQTPINGRARIVAPNFNQ